MKRIRRRKTKLLVAIGLIVVLMALSLLAVWIWTVKEPSSAYRRPLLWRVKQLLPWFRRSTASRVVCGTNVSGLAKSLLVYANDCDGKYPPGDKWCDLLIKYDFTTKKQFICIDARSKGDKGPSHYAINPNANPASDIDVVLVFETKGGWNQSGGPEILATRKHYGGRKGCNVAFVDGHVRFVQKKELGKLKWK